jgi:hypothetical protein
MIDNAVYRFAPRFRAGVLIDRGKPRRPKFPGTIREPKLSDEYHFSARVPRRLHKELKLLSIALDIPLQRILIEAFQEYLAWVKDRGSDR